MINDLFSEIDNYHCADPCNDPSKIDRFEEECGFELPEDFKLFYRRYESVGMFGQDSSDFLYFFLPISDMQRTRIDILGEDSDEWAPATWLSVCYLQDGNYIAIDVASKNGNEYNYIDCFHETFGVPGYCTIIAKSFTELLCNALYGSDNLVFFLEKGFKGDDTLE